MGMSYSWEETSSSIPILKEIKNNDSSSKELIIFN